MRKGLSQEALGQAFPVTSLPIFGTRPNIVHNCIHPIVNITVKCRLIPLNVTWTNTLYYIIMLGYLPSECLINTPLTL